MTTEELYYRAAMSGDNRFDGWVYVGVTSTGIYCRPSCPAKTPKRANMRFFRTAGSAQAAGFRACKRCRPEVTPGSPEWNVRADLAGRAMRLIADGLVDREGVTGLAARLNYSERQLRRQLQAELGAGPQALARGQRSRTAQLLLATTDLAMSDVAFAAGFVSIRQFNETIRDVFAQTPTQLRARSARHDGDRAGAGVLVVRLPFRAPLNLTWSLRHLGERAVPGVEEYQGGVYRRVLALPHATGVVSFTPEADAVMAAAVRSSTNRPVVRCELQLEDLRDLTAAVQRCRALLDLDADPQAIDAVLGADAVLAPVVSASPGRRVPGTGDPAELALRAVLAQDAPGFAGEEAARLVARFGKPLTVPIGSITHTFPRPEILADADLSGLYLNPRRQAALRAMATALANRDVDLDVGAEREQAVEQLRAIPELKAVTIAAIRMRALGDPDVFVPDDPTVARVLHEHGISGRAAVTRHAENWRPWRSYAVSYLLDRFKGR